MAFSRGMVSERGMAGRFISIIVDCDLEPTPRTYSDPYEWCSGCGACIRRCPARAIGFESGKNNALCKGYLDKGKETTAPRYGCGKCQVGVPCESGRPWLAARR